ncbi:hypothetical protein SAMN04515656_11927 [Eubacterium aggregans]|uniref:CARDB protein n=1 Tax=Eubacterium aggregans TaxID=81409 RepID=A0A1H4D0H1_9FIRM|nr:hypothetical protein [Eubacterium aggregans]SEA66026.1 hypothetical protein SAMN04515656_11927 [Eubacterium aggregans]
MKKLLSILTIVAMTACFFTAPVAAAPNQPLLQITSVSTYPEAVSPGDNFDVFLTIVNNGNYNAYNTNISVLNISGSKTSDLDVFSMSGSGNHVYVGQVDSFGATSATLHMAVSPVATAKNYNLNIQIDTVDGDGNSYSYPETIGLFVNESTSMSLVAPSELTVSSENSTTTTATDSKDSAKGNLSMEVANLGTNAVRGVQLQLSGSGLSIKDTSTYYGTFEKDDADTFTTTVTADTPGNYDLTAELRYVDSFNNERKITKNIKITVPDNATSTNKTGSGTNGTGSTGLNILTDIAKVLFGITV